MNGSEQLTALNVLERLERENRRWRYLIVLLFLGLLMTGLSLALAQWRALSAQQSTGRYSIAKEQLGALQLLHLLDTTTGEVRAFLMARDQDLVHAREVGITEGTMKFLHIATLRSAPERPR